MTGELKRIEMPDWQPQERIRGINDEVQNRDTFTNLANMAMKMRDGSKNQADYVRKACPDLAAFFDGAAFAWHQAWWLLTQQAQTRSGDIGPAQFASAFVEPIIKQMEALAVSAKAAYAVGLGDIARVTGERVNGNDL